MGHGSSLMRWTAVWKLADSRTLVAHLAYGHIALSPLHIAKLNFENGHDGQLLALEVFAKGMPNHQVAEVDVAEIATLSSLEC